MGHTIGLMTWNACQSCKHMDSLLGGCLLGVPESFDMMTLSCDYIECNKYEDQTSKPYQLEMTKYKEE